MRKAISVILCLCLCVGIFVGCEKEKTKDTLETKVEANNDSGKDSKTTDDNDVTSDSDKNAILTEIGTIEDADKKINITDSEGIYIKSGEDYRTLSYLGDNTEDTPYRAVNKISDGLYTVAGYEENVNVWGLINDNDETLIPCEAAKVESLSDRYVKVLYATKQTKKEEDCFIYTTDSYFSLNPDEDSVMYKGYCKVYDVETKSFVDGIKITSSAVTNSLKACGDNIYLKDEKNIHYFINNSGKTVYQTTDSITILGDTFSQYSSNVYKVCDQDGKQLFTCVKHPMDIRNSGYYYYSNEEGQLVIVNNSGNQVLTGDYEIAYEYHDGIFKLSKGDYYYLVKEDGTVVAKEKDSISFIGNGYWDVIIKEDDEYKHKIYSANGLIAEGVDTVDSVSELCYYQNDETYDKSILILSTGKTIDIKSNGIIPLTTGLAAVQSDETGLYNIIDLVSGQTLKDYTYEDVKSCGNYLYGYKDRKWTVMEVGHNN